MPARPLIIVGASRSGTGVLREMLGLHPLVRQLGEIHFFEQFYTSAEEDAALTRPEAEALASRLLHHALNEVDRPYRPQDHADETTEVVNALPRPARATEVYRGVLTACGHDRAWVIDKTPGYVRWIPEVLSVLPDAIVVVITRDPRDVLLSQKRWYRNVWKRRSEVSWGEPLRHFLQYHPLLMSLLWRSAARAGQRVVDPRVIHLRFEDLVTNPRRAVEPLLAATGLHFEDSMLEVARRGSSNRPGVRSGGFDPAVIGRWRGGLSATEQWITHRVCGKLMSSYGYVAGPARPGVGALAWAVISLPLRTAAALFMATSRSKNLRQSILRRL